MIKLDDNTWVAADQIAEVSVTQECQSRVAVFMKDGRVNYVTRDYSKSVYWTAQRIVDAVAEAQAK